MYKRCENCAYCSCSCFSGYYCERKYMEVDPDDSCIYFEDVSTSNSSDDASGCAPLIGFALLYQAVHYIDDKFGVYGNIAIMLILAIIFRKQVKFILKWCLLIGTSLLVVGPIAMSLILVIPKTVFGSRDAEIFFVVLAWIILAFVAYKLLIKDFFKKLCQRWR